MDLVEDKIECLHFPRNRYFLMKMYKPTILFMAITRFGSSQRHDIAFVTSEYKFYFYSLRFALHMHHISYLHHDKIREIFRHFNITEQTDLLVQDTVDPFCPLFLYFKIISPYAKFRLLNMPLTKIVKRIYTIHPTFSKQLASKKSQVTLTNVNVFLYKAWNLLKDLDVCPWISNAVDTRIKLMDVDEMHHQQRARMCLYYMLIKKQFYLKNKKYEKKPSEILASQETIQQ